MKHDPPQPSSDGLETAEVPAAPVQAETIFGDQFPIAQRYAELLAGSGVIRGLIGPREAPRLWERHILNCAVMTDLIAADSTVVDVGSGAGLPGLVIAIRRPDLSVTLVEPLLRRVRWLDEVIDELGLTNVTVVRGRAETVWDEVAPADVVTSRAVSALENLAVWSVPLVRPGGWWLPMKGASVAEEIDQGRELLAAVGITEIEIVECGAEILDEPTTVARLRVGVPRRLGKSGAKKGAKKPSRRQSANGHGRTGQ
ncbi:16S rRNA (guanine(527)-N(7))-methyltransferase RsmG [Flexivirga alba]|uniref:Ribosomal RNA small subunit methyltransferase G n=1 Tax=Flexivirga alba TaxID=702742 RepID=A0ABW2ADN3_9MICO